MRRKGIDWNKRREYGRAWHRTDRAKELKKLFYSNPEKMAQKKKKDSERYRRNREKMLDRNLFKKYGITKEEQKKIYNTQKGLDAITGLPLPKDFATDHDHETKKVRGLLSKNINTGLGMFQDNPAWLRAAADYIEKHRGICE